MMSPLRGLPIYSMFVPTSDDVGYCYVAPSGLRVWPPLSPPLFVLASAFDYFSG
jgi:hypothetical protein